MIMNKIGNDKCTEKLMELPDGEWTLNITICRQVELTNAHIKSLKDSRTEQHIHQAGSSGSNRGRGRGRRTARDRGYCERCCRTHRYGECRAFHQYCSTCGEKGHLHGQNCANATVKRLQCSKYQTKCRTVINYTQIRCRTIMVI